MKVERAWPSACVHPRGRRTRDTTEVGSGVYRIQETCGRCLAVRHYRRDDNAATMSPFGPWSEPRVKVGNEGRR